jgi:lipoprotein-anchoring transpeptidase ErfK/SrfK
VTDDIERRLRDAFDVRARAAVGDAARPPVPRYLERPPRRRVHLLAPLAAAAAVLVAVGGSMLAVRATDDHRAHRPAAALTRRPATPPASGTAAGRAGAAPVRIRLGTAGERTYGVGMPVVAYFSRTFTTAAPLSEATSVTVDGKPVQAAWYFEHSSVAGYPIEGHLRMRTYWPAHASIRVTLATDGVPAGRGLAFVQDASLTFRTGARTVAVVDDAKHHMVVTEDGKPLGAFPVSLGAQSTPTFRGVKVIMDKRDSVCLTGPGFSDCGVKYAQQMTYSGEYLHAAPWNVENIKRGVDSSNGCTNLLPGDAQRLYTVLKVGDVIDYPDASGSTMPMHDGFADWNVPWRVWVKGGLVPSS